MIYCSSKNPEEAELEDTLNKVVSDLYVLCFSTTKLKKKVLLYTCYILKTSLFLFITIYYIFFFVDDRF